jgi:hypothetical protein
LKQTEVSTDPALLQRAVGAAQRLYPGARIVVRRGRVIALMEDGLIRLLKVSVERQSTAS